MGAPSGTLIYDVETYSRDLLNSMRPEEYVRLIGYKWKGDREVTITTDLEELRAAIRSARWIVGHNINDFDNRAVFGIKSNEPVELAMQGRVYDTWTHAALVHTTPSEYTNRHGSYRKAPAKGWKPEQMLPWFGLDEQAYQLGVAGKTADLKELAYEFGDPDLPTKARIRDGFGKIPVDDPRYVEYLIGDVLASERVATELLKLGPLSGNGERYPDRDYIGYPMREQEIEARKAVISSNGLAVNEPKAKARRDELAVRRDEIMRTMVDRYGLPDEEGSPWETNEGKRAILAALADYGITPDTVDWPTTPGMAKKDEKLGEIKEKVHLLEIQVEDWKEELAAGELRPASLKARERWIEKAEADIAEKRENPLPPAFGLSLSGDTLVALTEGTEAESLGRALAELKGQRSLSALALDCMYPDGRVHPEITMLQRSGRWSTTEPGLTVWTNNGPGAIEKDYFIPDSDDDVLMEFDLSNADARAVAAESGDRKYAERFVGKQDSHLINAWAAWGREVVGDERDEKGKPTGVTAEYRQKAKALGHGWNYGGQAKTLAGQAGLPLSVAEEFCSGMAKAFPVLMKWQDNIRAYARRYGCVVNSWGRVMQVEKGREFTQAPALIGQSTTREIMCDVLLRMPLHILRRVKAQIHDALLLSVPKRNWEECRDFILDLMYSAYEPTHGNGQHIEFPADAGPPGESWYAAIH